MDRGFTVGDGMAMEVFEAWMGRALHDEQRGYYARKIRGVGVRGDFTTGAKVSGILGRAVAAWLKQGIEETGVRNIVEIGPGDGSLMAAVRAEFSWWQRKRLNWYGVDRSEPLQQQQEQRWGRAVEREREMERVLERTGGKVLVFSNELVDAFPVRVFKKSGDGWLELHVERGERGVEERWLERDLPESCVFEHHGRQGQRVEVHESYRRWLDQWQPMMKAGRVLTIDYGGPVESLYHRQVGGSVRGYFLQQRVEGMEIYQREGQQDLTADVNFTDLAAWGSSRFARYQMGPMGEFLLKRSAVLSEGDRYMVDENGAGQAFWVLEQQLS